MLDDEALFEVVVDELVCVVVGSVDPTTLYAAFHVNALAVPSSLIRIVSFCPSYKVPVGAAIVAFTASAVTLY